MTKKSKRGMLFPPAIGYSMTVVLSLIIKNKLSLKYFFKNSYIGADQYHKLSF